MKKIKFYLIVAILTFISCDDNSLNESENYQDTISTPQWILGHWGKDNSKIREGFIFENDDIISAGNLVEDDRSLFKDIYNNISHRKVEQIATDSIFKTIIYSEDFNKLILVESLDFRLQEDGTITLKSLKNNSDSDSEPTKYYKHK